MPSRRERVPLLPSYHDDSWEFVRVASGTELLALWPLESGYFFTFDEFERADGRADALYRRLQLRRHPFFGFKPAVAVVRVTGRSPQRAEAAVRSRNRRFGSGGATMLRLPSSAVLDLIEVLPLAGTHPPRSSTGARAIDLDFVPETGRLTVGDSAITPLSTPDDVARTIAIDEHTPTAAVRVDGLGPSHIDFTWQAGRLATASIMAGPRATQWQQWTHTAFDEHVHTHVNALCDRLEAGRPLPRGAIGVSVDPHNHCASIAIDFTQYPVAANIVAHDR